MTREEYAKLIELAAALWEHEFSPATVSAWEPLLRDFTLADAEDAMRRLVRQHSKVPAVNVIRTECSIVARNHRRPPIVAKLSAAERERGIRFGRLIGAAARAGALHTVHEAMAAAKGLPLDPLEAGEAALHEALRAPARSLDPSSSLIP
jgi:hypothetical protein